MTSHNWRFVFDDTAERQFSRLDKAVQTRIIRYVEKIEKSQNPKSLATQLTGHKTQFWRYRVGDYRIVVRFENHDMIILAVKIAHRREVYQ